ncbi:MAG: CdaR family protein [Clostridiales bacterium]|nr:CdaR family protein [Clostridiales bacterium]
MKKNDIGAIILNWLKGFFTKNLALKIVSLLFAMLIWGYVMVEVNPKRVKTITDVPISFSGESSLHDRGLAVRGDRDDILRNVTVRVKVQLTDYTGLDASDISASVSLRPVNKADTYKLKIDATSSLGTVENVSPSEISIEVDELATMLVPIDVEYSGELPDGYWKSEPTLASQSIKVSGPRDDVSTISKAICTIDLEDRTTSYNEAILLKYVDKNGDEIDTALFLDTLPSVVVKMDVMRIVELPINAADAVLGADALPANYEVYDVVATPPTVRVVGSENALSGLTGIKIENIDVSGSTSSVQQNVVITAPEGTTLLDDPNITVYVGIREKQDSAQFKGVPIETKGLGKKLTAELSATECEVNITGRTSLMKLLQRKDVSVYVDLTGLTAGTYKITPMVSLASKEMQTDLQWTVSLPEVTVTIKE